MYDFNLDDAGISRFDDDEEGKERKVRECFFGTFKLILQTFFFFCFRLINIF